MTIAWHRCRSSCEADARRRKLLGPAVARGAPPTRRSGARAPHRREARGRRPRVPQVGGGRRRALDAALRQASARLSTRPSGRRPCGVRPRRGARAAPRRGRTFPRGAWRGCCGGDELGCGIRVPYAVRFSSTLLRALPFPSPSTEAEWGCGTRLRLRAGASQFCSAWPSYQHHLPPHHAAPSGKA